MVTLYATSIMCTVWTDVHAAVFADELVSEQFLNSMLAAHYLAGMKPPPGINVRNLQ